MKEGIHDNFVLFYSNNSVYSNFYPAEFSDPEFILKLPKTSKHHGSQEFRFGLLTSKEARAREKGRREGRIES